MNEYAKVYANLLPIFPVCFVTYVPGLDLKNVLTVF
jgi:hypothetical protein